MFRPRQVSVRLAPRNSTSGAHRGKKRTHGTSALENEATSAARNSCANITSENSNNAAEIELEETRPSAIEGCLPPDEQGAGESDTDEVKQDSSQQRDALDGEPKCVVCGKYGEYVCNETEEDVCSMECKAVNLRVMKDRLKRNGVNTTAESVQVDQWSDSNKNVENDAQLVETTGITSEDASEINTLDPFQISQIYKTSYIYREHETVSKLKTTQVSLLCKQLGIMDDAASEKAKKPIYEFSHCRLNNTIADNLKSKNYETPTPVQMQVIPYALSMEDVIVCSGTASGKTLGFLLPMISHINAFNEAITAAEYNINSRDGESHPLGLIIAPTRELASQIEDEAKSIAKGLYGIKTALLIGGVALPPQLHRLKQGIQIIIATPGRLYDVLILDESPLHLDLIQAVVIDEVDCILKMGFQSQVDKIWAYLPHDLQTMMFSATIPEAVKVLAQKLTRSPIGITVESPCRSSSHIKHVVLWVDENSKKKRLFQILDHQKHFDPPALIFVESKIGAEFLEEAINKMTSRICLALHGDKNQKDRFDILKKLEDGDIEIIVTTGVLGRGLDLVSVKQVIHFDVAKTLDEFIHRSGRAGRLGANGTVISFLNNTNKEIFCDFYDYMKTVQATIPPELEHSPFRLQRNLSRKSSRNRQERKRLNASEGRLDCTSGSSLLSLLKTRPR